MSITLSRPRILTAAAKAGAAIYRRERDLARLAPRLFAGKRQKNAVIDGIAAAEAACDVERRSGAVTYSIERHIGLLAALFAEAGGAAQA